MSNLNLFDSSLEEPNGPFVSNFAKTYLNICQPYLGSHTHCLCNSSAVWTTNVEQHTQTCSPILCNQVHDRGRNGDGGGPGGLKAPSTFGFRIFALETVALASCDFLSLQMAGPCGVPKVTLSAQAAKSYRPYDVQRLKRSPFLVFLYRVVSVKTTTLHLFRFDSERPVFFVVFFQPNTSYLIVEDRLWCCQLTLFAPRQHQSSEQKPDQNKNAPCHSEGSDVMRWSVQTEISSPRREAVFMPIPFPNGVHEHVRSDRVFLA